MKVIAMERVEREQERQRGTSKLRMNMNNNNNKNIKRQRLKFMIAVKRVQWHCFALKYIILYFVES